MKEIVFDLQRFDITYDNVGQKYISGTSGNDIMTLTRSYSCTLSGGAGNDLIHLNRNLGGNTIIGGAGNDSLSSYNSTAGTCYFYRNGDGYDYIYGDGYRGSMDWIRIDGGYYSKNNVGSHAVITMYDSSLVPNGAITVTAGASQNIRILYGTAQSLSSNYFYNTANNTVISGTTANDTIKNSGSTVTINSGVGNDSISNTGNYVTINGGTDNDSISNTGNYVSIDSGVGSDYVFNSGSNVTIDGGNENVTVSNSGSNVKIYGGTDNDSISNSGSSVTIDSGIGDDKVSNTGGNVTINGGNGNDTVSSNKSDNVVISGGWGNDVIDNYFGNYVSINAGGDDDRVWNYGNNSTVDGGSGADFIGNTGSNSKIYGGYGNDTISNQSENVTISGGGENDSISNFMASKVLINGDDGDDYIENGDTVKNGDGSIYVNQGGSYATLNGGEGDDVIASYANYVTIDGGSGNDVVSSSHKNYSNVCLRGGEGNDTLTSNGTNITINGGTGNDIISLGSDAKNNLIGYTSGDGNDVVYGFNTTSTLKIGNGTDTYSQQTLGSNVVVTVGGGKITLVGAANLSSLKIAGKEINPNSWKLNGTTATYGTTEKTLITVTGVKSLDGISLNDKVVTIAKSSLNSSKITISGDGYTLALASGISAPSTTSAGFTVSGTTATYESEKTTAGYTLASDKKSVTYTAESGGNTLFTVKGLKSGTSTSNLSLSGSTVTLKAGALGTNKVTISNGYTLALAKDVDTPTAKSGEWSISGTTATYKTSGLTAGYTLSSDKKSVTYSTETGGAEAAKLTGLKSGLSVSNGKISGVSVNENKITVASSVIGSGKAVTATGEGYVFVLNGNSENNTLVGGTGADTLKGGEGDDSLKGGSGKDIFVYAKGNGDDVITDYTVGQDKIKLTSGKISSASVKGSDVILKIGSGSITLKNMADKKITVIDSSGNETTQTYSAEKDSGLTVKNGTVYVSSSFEGDEIDLVDYSPAKNVYAATFEENLTILGTGKNNSLVGGKGDDLIQGGAGKDTLTGGRGDDIFVHTEGKDIIADYASGEDKIQIANGVDDISGTKYTGNNVIITTTTGSVTVKGGKGKGITIVDDQGNEENLPMPLPKYLTYNASKTMLTAAKNYSGVIDLTAYTQTQKAKIVNAAAVTNNVEIIGNALNNSLVAGSGDDTLYGGKGKDTLTGGTGSDIFIHTGGSDIITDYNVGEDVIQLGDGVEIKSAKLKVKDVILTTNTGTITVKDAKNKKITVADSDGNETTKIYPVTKMTGLSYNSGKTVLTVKKTFAGETIELADYASTVKTVNAKAATVNVEIIGNKLNNSLIGGAGNDTLGGGKGKDTLTGGKGNDVFVYTTGTDVITDYKAGEDKIQLDDGVELQSWKISGSNVIFSTSAGKFTVKSGKNKKITIVDEDGNKTTKKYSTSGTATSALFAENNFVTSDNLSAIVENNLSAVSEIETQNFYSFTQENLIVYSAK